MNEKENQVRLGFTDKQLANFWAKVDKSGDCWNWVGAKSGGYGIYTVAEKTRKAHRLAVELTSGPIPGGMFVCHKCDNRTCCNPDHLFLGTAEDNVRDMVSKGRGVTAYKCTNLHQARLKRGDEHHGTKLSDAQVAEMRSLFEGGTRQADLARKYGVSHSVVSLIVRNLARVQFVTPHKRRFLQKSRVQCYTAGAFSSATPDGVRTNIDAAAAVADAIYEAGGWAACPHTLGERFAGRWEQQRCLDGTLEWMLRCDCVVMVSNWNASKGAVEERRVAKEKRIPVFYALPDGSLPDDFLLWLNQQDGDGTVAA